MENLAPRFLPPQGWQWRDNLETRSGQFIRLGWVVPANARAHVAIFPGLSEYTEKYFEMANDLVARGFAVSCLDWRGQGLSWRQGDRAKRYHDDFAHDVDDAKVFLKCLPVPASLPRILLAHSMGGHIGLRVMHDDPAQFRCAVLTAPLLGLNLPESLALGIARSMSAFGMNDHYAPAHGPWTDTRFNTNLNILSSDDERKDMQVYWMTNYPDLRMGGLTIGWTLAALNSIRTVRNPAFLKSVITPCLLISGTREMVVSNAAIGNVAKILPHAEHLSVSGALHEIMMERDIYRNQFWHAFDAFIAKHL